MLYPPKHLRMKKQKKIKLSEKDLEAINKQLGFHQAGVEYDVTVHDRNVYRSTIKADWRGVYR